MMREPLLISLFALIFVLPTAFGDTVDITVRRAPYTVGGTSSKSEKAWCPCKYCGSKTGYERKYKWDYDKLEWIETTKSEDVPDVCRKCKQKVKEQEKLDQKERKLDQQIETQRTRLRIKDKTQELKTLKKDAR